MVLVYIERAMVFGCGCRSFAARALVRRDAARNIGNVRMGIWLGA